MQHDQKQLLSKRYKQIQLGIFTRKNSAFLAPLLCSLDIKFEKPEGPSKNFIMCCDSDTIYINPDRFLDISYNDASFILEHELWHIARMHNMRQNNRDPRLWNEACDHVINLAMLRDGATCSIEGLHDYQYTGMSEEEVYTHLKEEQESQNSGSGTDTKIVPPSDEEGNDLSHDLVPDNSAKKQTRQLASISKAKQQAQMSNGLEPGSMAGDLTSLWEKVLAPKLPWESILHNLMKDLIPKAKLSWKRRNRRFSDIHLPSMVPNQNRLSHLIYAIDTSGSVDDKMLARINSEIKYIHDHIKPKLLTVIQFDTEIQHEDKFKDNTPYKQLQLHGGGGTDYQCIKTYVDKIKEKIDGLVIFTDLYANPMKPLENTSIPVFWIAVNTQHTESIVKFGKFIKVEI